VNPRAQRTYYLVAALPILVVVLANQLHAQPTAALYLNSPGSGANLAGVYTSPYTGTINGGPTIKMICDDFADDSYVPESWTAYVASLQQITSGTAPETSDVKWQGSTFDTSLSQAQAYEVAAILSIEILQATTGSTQQKDLSFALWGLFDPNGNGVSGDPGAFGQLALYGDTTDENAAIADLNTAVGDLTTGIQGMSVSSYLSNYNVTIYSYDVVGLARRHHRKSSSPYPRPRHRHPFSLRETFLGWSA